jgi:hypothetical protein
MKKTCRLKALTKKQEEIESKFQQLIEKSIQEGWVSILHKALTFKNIKEVYYGIVYVKFIGLVACMQISKNQ